MLKIILASYVHACMHVFVCVGNYSISYQYLVSVYWATATSTTVGYGDISAHNDIEVYMYSYTLYSDQNHMAHITYTQRVYAVLVMVLGVLAYGYIIASVAASLANADSARAQYQEKLKGIKSFMDVCQYTSTVAPFPT